MSQFVKTTNIILTEREEKIFQLLRDTVTFHNRGTVLRVAGGWVRDKLLGVESDDIDVATDDCMGVEFAVTIQDYLSSKESKSEGNEEEQHAGKIGVISANPEQSKHLETATMKIYGQEIDFVNLRSEEYSDTSSRIPTMTFGTPSQDAYRRDFTINSLFYNIMTNSIEDWTSNGLNDLKNGYIRTPLPVLTTFSDDPLRILRAVRFASRYNFLMDSEIIQVGKMSNIHEALQHKVSKERIAKELNGCFCGKLARPIVALNFIKQMNLFGYLFSPPSLSQLQSQRASVNMGTSQVLSCQQKKIGESDMMKTEECLITVERVLETWQTTSLHTIKAINFLLQIELMSHELSLFTKHNMVSSATVSTPSMPLDMTALVAAMDTMQIAAISSSSERIAGTSTEDMCNSTVISSETLLQPLGKKGDGENDFAIDGLEARCSVTALLWASCVAGLRDVRMLTAKKKTTSLHQVLLCDGFKLSTNMLKLVDSILSHSYDFRTLATALTVHSDTEDKVLSIAELRENIGVVLRSCKDSWRSSLLMACALDLAEVSLNEADHDITGNEYFLTSPVLLRHAQDLPTKTTEILMKYQQLFRAIELLGLDKVWSSTTPFFHGKALLSELEIARPGPVVGLLADFQFRWQVRNPIGTKEECLSALKEELQRVTEQERACGSLK